MHIFVKIESEMLGISEHKVIVSGKFAEAVRKAAKDSANIDVRPVPSKKSSDKAKFRFEWK